MLLQQPIIFGLVYAATIFGNLRRSLWWVGAPGLTVGVPTSTAGETLAVFTAAISGVETWRGGEAPPLRGRNRAINDFPTGCKHSVDTAPHLSPNAHFPPSEQKKCNDDMKYKCCTITFDHFLPALVKCQCASTGFLNPDLHLPPATATPVPHTNNCCSLSAFSVITSPLIY